MNSGAASKAMEIAGDYQLRKDNNPYVEIVEQPASKAIRFRYKCEGRSAGSIPGANSVPENRTFPTIQIHGYRGRGIVIVSCVTKDEPYRPHPHSLVGKDTCARGICRIEITPDMPVIKFVNLGIQCVKKKDIFDALEQRRELRVDPFRTGYDQKGAAGIDLNSVRLCFQVFVEGSEGKINVPLRPVVSEPIYDKKAMSDLIICKMSPNCATVEGGTEIIVLCEKVVKDNIQVRFFEKLDDGSEVWEAFGDFKPIDVHKQVAIALRTPSYRHRRIEEPIQIFVELRRPSDGATSEAWPFRMLPLEALDPESLRQKRRKFAECPKSHVLRQLQAEAEKEAALYRLRNGFDHEKFEPRQTFPVTTDLLAPVADRSPTSSNQGLLVDVSCYGAQVSPASSLPSPIANGSFNIPFGQTAAEANANSPLHTTRDTCGPTSSLGYYQQTLSRQPPMPVYQRNFEKPEEGAVEGAGITSMPQAAAHQSCTLDSSLNIHNVLDSAELEAYISNALSETLSSGLSITECTTKMEMNADLGASVAIKSSS